MNAPLDQMPYGIPVEVEVEVVRGREAQVLYDGESLEARVVDGVHVEAGAQALLIRTLAGELYLTASVGRAASEDGVTLEDGARALRQSDPERGELLRVLAPDGRVLFEYASRDAQAAVYVSDTDLRIEVGGRLTLQGDGGVDIVTPETLGVSCGQLNVAGDKADVVLESADLRAKRLLTRVDHIKTIVDLVETTAGRIVERARDALRETEGLTQIRAGRLRLMAQTSLHTLAERTVLVSRGDTKLKGNRIHLG